MAGASYALEGAAFLLFLSVLCALCELSVNSSPLCVFASLLPYFIFSPTKNPRKKSPGINTPRLRN
jgi:hypothetical protein